MKTPTPKQVRKHYKNCRYFFWRLQAALNKAHEANVINYRPYGHPKEAPDLPNVCDLIWDAKQNFDTATEKARAEAMKQELMKELKGVW